MAALIDRSGQRLERATVKSLWGRRGKSLLWECVCDCGNVFFAQANNIKSGRTKSCGCLKSQTISRKKKKDITGKRFGTLTAISRSKGLNSSWDCVCDCGKIVKVATSRLNTVKSCGCMRRKHNSDYERGKKWRMIIGRSQADQ